MCGTRKAREAATAVVRRLRDAGFQALLAGGCVRDLLMSRDPSDFDVATNALPEKVLALFEKTVAVGVSFGVVIVLDYGVKVEIATFRADGIYEDGRRPASVTFCDVEGDAGRRDFTVNAMYYDPLNEEIIDLVGGRDDIERRVIRTVGAPADRFAEDHLRMLRAARFATTLGFVIEPATAQAVRDLSSHISSVSAERVRDELAGILGSPKRAEGVALLDDLFLLDNILPEVTAMKGVEQSPVHHPEGDAYRHTLCALEKLGEADFVTAMSVLLHDIGKPVALAKRGAFYGHESRGAEMAREICARLRVARADTDRICWAIAKHLVLKDVTHMKQSTLRRLLGHEWFPTLREVFRTDLEASSGDLSNYGFVQAKLEEYADEPVLPPPLLSGQDLLARGFEEGPRIGRMLELVRDAQLEGRLGSREEALAYVEQSMKNLA